MHIDVVFFRFLSFKMKLEVVKNNCHFFREDLSYFSKDNLYVQVFIFLERSAFSELRFHRSDNNNKFGSLRLSDPYINVSFRVITSPP